MKIVCEACQAKYSIADDKVRGKAFKIRCKKCSHIIVVRGGEGGAAEPVGAPAMENAWHVVIDGEQVGPLPESDIRARLQRGEISGESYIWRDGMADWVKASSLPEFAGAASGAASGGAEADPFASVPTPAGAGGGFASPFAAAASSSDADVFAAPTVVTPSASADLFAAVSPARAEPAGAGMSFGSSMMSGAAAEPAGRHGTNGSAGPRVESLTGQRHENSVLFSLSNLEALAAPSPASAAPRPGLSSSGTTEGSGLIDIRSMAAMTLGSSSGAESRPSVDLPSFAAPQFSPVAPVLLPVPSGGGAPRWAVPLLVLLIVLLMGMMVATYKVYTSTPVAVPVAAAPVAEPPAAAPVAAAPPPAAKPAAAEPAPTPPPADEPLPPRDPPKTAAADKPSRPTPRAAAPARESARESAKEAPKKTAAKETPPPAPEKPVVAAAPAAPAPAKSGGSDLDSLLESALTPKRGGRAAPADEAPAAKKSGGSSDTPLMKLEKEDMVKAMQGVQGKVQECFNQYKVPGTAMVNVSVARGGKVSSASVTGKFSGTPTGSCIESAVKTAKFPACEPHNFPYPFALR